MGKERVDPPKHVRERVLAEFNHRCSVCGADRPQLHHIDGNPIHNEPLNLLPLCPNCHLTDQHNPTAPIDPAKLALFREYKDPMILSAQFHPLYLRFSYLMHVEQEQNLDSARSATVELIAFVNALKMGGFYHTRIADLLTDNAPNITIGNESDYAWRQKLDQRDAKYREKLTNNRKKAVDLVVEMLRYQDWPAPSTRQRRASAT